MESYIQNAGYAVESVDDGRASRLVGLKKHASLRSLGVLRLACRRLRGYPRTPCPALKRERDTATEALHSIVEVCGQGLFPLDPAKTSELESWVRLQGFYSLPGLAMFALDLFQFHELMAWDRGFMVG